MAIFKNLFSFLFQRSTAEERVAAYVIREHDRGRALSEILEDPYITNRLSDAAAGSACSTGPRSSTPSAGT